MSANANFVPPPEDSSQSFLIKLVTFMSEDDFENSLNAFLRDNASKVEVTGPDEEQKLGTYEIYQNYLKLVETKFEGFSAAAGLTPDQFQSEFVKLKQSDENGGKFLDALIASWDFEKFLQLVQDFLQEEMEEDQPEAQDDDNDDDQGRRSRDEEIIDF
mmetsp:Transcript_20827/g.34851  ORF Transcript_20827/g.34851 Transcript_20827/m.34851 type:complete len:159 (-) Transcript_20827:465-941(-)|eukprot:CAMPEP_0198213618 /NCGR_PEP_ID=MMETSP1445-20131203/28969_1 /TAXON_ID=36898 /ORGANISM="Pyramimonas sp., Strain CCMP2087" /LENGTH=158 /DNA_ID=CAMNT_0043888285 /DNA_START=160 /DNA_END=636 /DNA_ORIENTATION=+